MQGMDGYENHITVFILQLHYFMDPSFVIPHPDQAAENAYAVIDMDDVISDIEGSQVIQGQLFGLFHRPPHRNPVEPVKNLMVGIAANLIFLIDKSGVDVLFRYKLRQQAAVLGKNALEPVQLGLLLPIYKYLIIILQLGPDIRRKQFKILVEHRLRSDVETDRLCIGSRYRRLQINFFPVR